MALPEVVIERIEGLTLGGPPEQPASRTVQVLALARTPRAGEPPQEVHLTMPLLDALYLLNMLEAMSKDHHLDHLRQPPGPAQ